MTPPPAPTGRARGRLAAAAAAAALLAPLAAACGDDGEAVPTGASEWALPNGDSANTRHVTDSRIDSSTVDELGQAWTIPIRGTGAFGNFAATPLIVDGVAYTQDLNSNVTAIDVETGEVRWERAYDSATVGPNGVAHADGRIFGATNELAFALDAATGEEVWRSERLVRNDNEGMDIAPGVHDGRVYVSTVPVNPERSYAGDARGIVHVLDAERGDPLWTFETVPPDLWSTEHREVNSGGGLWHPPGFDEEGAAYISIANPAPFPGTPELPWGTSRPGPNPDTNTLVKLDAETGEPVWKTQVLPHDVYDWDLHLPPIVTEADGRELVLTGGKMGHVYAMDRESGEVVWERSVGEHSGNDDDNLTAMAGKIDEMPELPLTLLPGFLGGVETQMAVADGVVYVPVVNLPTRIAAQDEFQLQINRGTGEFLALDVASGEVRWQRELDAPPYGAATVVNDLVFTTTYDGVLRALDRETGEDVWSEELPAGTNSTVAVSGDTLVTAAGLAQAADQRPVIVGYRLGAEGAATETAPGATGTAPGAGGGTTEEAPAADGASLFEANCASCHALEAAGASGQVGPNLDRSTLDRGATAQKIRNGGGGMPAFGAQLSDEQIQALAEYVVASRRPEAARPDPGQPGGGQGVP